MLLGHHNIFYSFREIGYIIRQIMLTNVIILQDIGGCFGGNGIFSVNS